MLPIVLPEVEVQYLFEQVKSQPGYRLRINLERQSIEAPIGPALGFEFDPFRKRCLLNGIDDISLTLEHDAEIRRYEARRQLAERSEERRVGKECVSTGRSRGSPY